MTRAAMRIGFLSTVLVGVAGASWAAPPNKTTFKNENANLSFFESTTIPCAGGGTGTLDTSGFIAAFTSVVRSNSGIPSSSQAFAFYDQFNSCTGTSVSGSAFIDNPQFTQQRTDSATLNVSFPLTDFSGASIGTLNVAVVVTGAGPTTKSNTHSSTHTGDILIKFSSRGEFRDATVSGSISFNGTEFVDNISFAQLASVRDGQMIIQQH